jgi:glycogen operon protein
VLSFKGIDNRAYYRLADGGRYYFDTTGTRNTLNMRHPHVLQLIIDSRRYWVTGQSGTGATATLSRRLPQR